MRPRYLLDFFQNWCFEWSDHSGNIRLSLADLLSSLSSMKHGHDTYLILSKTDALKGLRIVQTFMYPSLIYCCHWVGWNAAMILTWPYRTSCFEGCVHSANIHLSFANLVSSLSSMKRGHDTYLILSKSDALKGLCIVQTFIYPLLIYCRHWVGWNAAAILTWFYQELMLWRVYA